MSRPTKIKTKAKTLDKSSSIDEESNKPGALEFSATKASGNVGGSGFGPSTSTVMPMQSSEIGYVHELFFEHVLGRLENKINRNLSIFTV